MKKQEIYLMIKLSFMISFGLAQEPHQVALENRKPILNAYTSIEEEEVIQLSYHD